MDILIKVGLTGGIACGKSKALQYLAELGAYTIDADRIARSVVQPGQVAYTEVVNTFGEAYINSDGQLDRKKLGNLIFSDSGARDTLNKIVHPKIIEEESRLTAGFEEKASGKTKILVVDAALMIEVGTFQKYSFVLIVYCPPAIQKMRLMDRDGFSEKDAADRIRSQMPLLEKVRFADYVIETSRHLSETQKQISYIYKDILHLSANC